jgi:hypothetical protein
MRLAIRSCHAALPSGLLRGTAVRNAFNSASVSLRFTREGQFRGRGSGQADKSARPSASPHRVEVFVGFDREGFEASLIDVARARRVIWKRRSLATERFSTW